MDRFQEFIDALYDAGWSAPNDAQWTNIKKVYNAYCCNNSTQSPQKDDKQPPGTR